MIQKTSAQPRDQSANDTDRASNNETASERFLAVCHLCSDGFGGAYYGWKRKVGRCFDAVTKTRERRSQRKGLTYV